MVYIITDDHEYRHRISLQFESQMDSGMLSFGPVHESKRIRSGTGCNDTKPAFKRETNTDDALLDFMTLAKMDDVYFTKGSSVEHFVRAQNARMHGGANYGVAEVIGDYNIAEKASVKFRLACRHFVQNNMDSFREVGPMQISHEQHNVLDFLSSGHLNEIYHTLETHLLKKNGRALASECGNVLSQNCRVVYLNRKKYQGCQPVLKGQHWMKALLNTRLLHYCSESVTIHNEIHYDESTHELFLVSMPMKRQFEQGSSSSQDNPFVPDAKKRHRQW